MVGSTSRGFARFAIVSLLIAASIGVSADDSLVVRVMTPEGEPATDVEVNLLNQWVWSGWRSVVKGVCSFDSLRIALGSDLGEGAEIDIFVRSPDFAPSITTLRYTSEGMEQTVSLQRGREIGIDLKPSAAWKLADIVDVLVYLPRHEGVVQLTRRDQSNSDQFRFESLYPVAAKRMSRDRYTVRLPEDFPPFLAMVDGRPEVRVFQTGPYELSGLVDYRLSISVPAPASLSLAFTPEASTKLFKSLYLQILQMAANSSQGTSVIEFRDLAIPWEQRIDGLMPGRYWVEIVTQPVAARAAEPVAGQFRDVRIVEVSDGEQREIEFELVPFNPTPYVGSATLEVTLTKHNGTPARGIPYKLNYSDQHYGMFTVDSGELGANGRLMIANLSGREHDVDASAFGVEGPVPQYMLELDGGNLGRFPIHLSPEADPSKVSFTLSPSVGDPAPKLELIDLATGEIVTVEDFRGQIVLIEFWATWCGPCDEPLRKLVAMSRRRTEDWAGRVVVLAASIDEVRETVVRFVSERGYDGPRFGWVGGDSRTGFDSGYAKAFGVSGIPTALLLDGEGIILWRGFPGVLDLESEIDRLLLE